MIDWAEWPDAEAATRWDDELVRLPGHSVYQAYGWGVYKQRSGWRVRRGSVIVDGVPVAMAQCLVREVPLLRTVMAWVPGGPAGRPEGRLALGAALRQRYRRWAVLLRANLVAERTAEAEAGLRAAGWRPARVRVGHPLTFQLDLTPDESERRTRLHGNWRHNLKRAERREHTVVLWGAEDRLDPVHAVCCEMAERKNLSPPVSLDDLRALHGALGKNFTLAVARAADGTLSAVRAFVRLGDRAWDAIAGASAAGRRSYASYLLLWALLELARGEGVCLYDIGGADPEGAVGVYSFKQGLGGQAVPLLGEWEWTSSRLLRRAVNVALAARGGTVAGVEPA